MTVRELFRKHDDEYLKFDRIENWLSNRPDVHAFILLDKLFPNGKFDLISAAVHDVYYIDIELEDLELLSEDQVVELIRCGISFDEEFDCLCSFT